MKTDQLSRLMRLNGPKNLWLLRNSSTLYGNSMHTYYQRSTSLTPYKSAYKANIREENRAPVRSLELEQTQRVINDYPRTHQQMTDQAVCATSTKLLNTVLQANRQRSMSNSAGGIRMYGSNMFSKSRDDTLKEEQPSLLGQVQPPKPIVFGGLSGRSMSLPPRRSLQLGMSYGLGKNKGSPSYRQHFLAMEKTMKGNKATASKRGHKHDTEQLMVVDDALKQRLAVRFDRQREGELSPARYRLGCGGTGMINRQISKSYSLRNDQPAHKNHFQPLGERIRQFEVIQFADGPVTYQAFKRTHSFGNGRTQHMGNKHLPKQQPCLSFNNVLHTNHRQRSLSLQARSQSMETRPVIQHISKLTVPLATTQEPSETVGEYRISPLGQLLKQPQTAKARPQPEQQQQQQQQPQRQKLQKLQKQQQKQQAQQEQIKEAQEQQEQQVWKVEEALGTQPQAKQPLIPKRKVLPARAKPKAKPKTSKRTVAVSKITPKKSVTQLIREKNFKRVITKAKSTVGELKPNAPKKLIEAKVASAKPRAVSMVVKKNMKTNTSNKLSRTSHLTFINGTAKRADQLRPRAAERVKVFKQNAKPQSAKQPASVKDANHLLAANDSQVSPCKRAFKNRQQIIQAGSLHQHAKQTLGKRIMSESFTSVKPKSEVMQSRLSKANIKQLSANIAYLKTKRPKKILVEDSYPPTPSLPPSPSPLAAVAQNQERSDSQTINGTVIKTPRKSATYPYSSAPATLCNYQKRQQQQLHQELQQRRLHPLESQWRRKN